MKNKTRIKVLVENYFANEERHRELMNRRWLQIVKEVEELKNDNPGDYEEFMKGYAPEMFEVAS